MRGVFNYFTKKQQSLGSAAFILMAMVLGSAVLGLIRLRILYNRFTPDETGIFFAAFRLPNLLFEVLAMGSLTAAFIPVFTKYLTKNKEKDAYELASGVINITLVLLTLFIVPLIIWAPQISQFLAPGFSKPQIDQMAYFTRIMVIFQVIPLIIGNYFTGILQSYKLFFIPALAPIVYNVGIILGIVFFSNTLGLTAPVVGVIIGAGLFFVIQLPLVFRVGYKHSWKLGFHNPGVREVGRLVAPRLLGLGASQIDLTVDLVLATLLGSKMVTVFFLAQSLQQLPVRLFGTTIAQAALPSLSAYSAGDERDRFKSSIISSYHMILFFVLPVSVILIVMRVPIVRLIYGASLFDWEATVLTAMTVSAFSVSLFAQSVSQIFVRGFYALYNSKTPVIVSVVTIILNSLLSVLFIMTLHYPVWYLGLSSSIASIVHAILLLILLSKQVNGFSVNDIFVTPLKMVMASIITGIMVYVPMKILDQLVIDTTRVIGLITLTGLVSLIGIVSYLFICWAFGLVEIRSILLIFDKLKKLRQLISQPSSEVVQGELGETN